MKINDNCVVTFHYSMTDETGDLVETSREGEPTAYLHGHRNMIETLEAAMQGKETGETFTVTLPPELAYGRVRSQSVMRVSIKNLKFEGKLEAGMTVPLVTNEGLRPVTVVKVGKFNVDIDTNHPLAGKTLTFDVEIIDVRKATQDELGHGHAHGAGGHHH
ncbi:FKBP-type peptidyl-prolyl cis-trans isomerase [Porticoccus sp.]|uniref:FKBP-type peptidyl-prolyl cis-trans isomerase n=1 Tax=Porticoccus sp. TaxID=2024853 RepID=UPI003F6A3077